METRTESDEAWLWNACDFVGIRPSDDQVEAFLERVAVRISEGAPEAQARSMTFTEHFG